MIQAAGKQAEASVFLERLLQSFCGNVQLLSLTIFLLGNFNAVFLIQLASKMCLPLF